MDARGLLTHPQQETQKVKCLNASSLGALFFDQHALCFYFQAVMHYLLQINFNYFLAIDLFLIWERGVLGFILL